MYKYRRLTIDELEILKEDFVKFLASNGIDSLEWMKLKTENLEEANNHIDLFSDIVIDNALNNIQWLEFFDGKSMKCFLCETDKIFLNSVQSPHLYTSWAEMVQNIKNAPTHFSTIKTQKN